MSKKFERPEWAKKFYSSNAWKECRKAYASSVGGLCERCMESGIYSPGEVVHHKTPLTAWNINDPTITLNWDNLMLVCNACHQQIHSGRRWKVDEFGRVVPPD